MVVDVVVVGAGHAGCEAAAAAARRGASVAMITLDLAAVGRLSCNPAIGGLAKGQLVRELDALGGVMARVADEATVQFRHLNTRKGLAVRSSRAQVDVDLYPRVMARLLATLPSLTMVQGEVADLVVEDGRAAGVLLADGRVVRAPKVVLTTGTFLAAVMHCGDMQEAGGRRGERPATVLAERLRGMGFRMSRLKTGTVPRLHKDSIDWTVLAKQEHVTGTARFGLRPPAGQVAPIDCYLTWTQPETLALVVDNLHASPLLTGAITGRGPRYCPSIEDKVRRFADKERHRIFLEPEGHETDSVYVNGLSTSLPAAVQDAMVASLPGCADAVVLQHGYAVEYDVCDPRDLGVDLQHSALPGLYLAGQINGTSGYEEAAVQGFVAGVNATSDSVFTLGRHEAYIGVLIDDLTTRGVGGEPYRMFTSRAEHRLLLREDNAADRLLATGRALGLVEDEVWDQAQADRAAREAACEALRTTAVHPNAETLARMTEAGLHGALKKPTTALHLLRRPGVGYDAVRAVAPSLPALSAEAAEQVESAVRYAPYIARAEARAAQTARADGVRLPTTVDWHGVGALSLEVRERLAAARPNTLGAASRLPGVTPAAVQVLAAWLQRRPGTEAGVLRRADA